MMDSEEEENVETNVEVDLEEEFLCLLSELNNLRKTN